MEIDQGGQNGKKEFSEKKTTYPVAALAALIISSLIFAGCSGSPGAGGENIYLCKADSDCAPRPECHPLECINQKYVDLSKMPDACTLIFLEEAAYSKEDCACRDGLCINKNRKPAQAGLTEEESQAIAREFLEKTSTFEFDGSGIEHLSTNQLGCANCWSFSFSFTSSHAGYGDRSGMMVAQVQTPHQAIINVERGRVTEGILDGEWDMLRDEPISGEE